MRLHELTVTAFGPFADSQTVAFDELNEAGLFLLTGPTGAGKSSLLDAVCFALYGTVPGARGVKVLKSQHAPVETRPEVVLDFSARDRRFVVRRTPEWTRPKRRGDGLITEKASAVLLETTDGEERMLSSRAAEVGLFLTDLMGMHASQFQQVVLLPQGEFSTFLRATSQERHDVLQQLFRTDRFARIEEWVHDRSRLLGEQASAGEAAVRALVERLAERSGSSVPDGLAGDGLPRAAAEGRLEPWTDFLLGSASLAAADTATAHDEATVALADTRAAHEAAVRRTELRARHRAAREALDDLERTADDAARGAALLDADGRAAAVRPLLAVLDEAERRLRQARQDPHTGPSADPPAGTGTGLDTGALAALLDAEREQAARLEALLPREQEATEAREHVTATLARLAETEQAVAASTRRCEALPDLMAETEIALGVAATRAGRREALAHVVGAARERRDAAAELERTASQVVALEDAWRDARDRVLDARERVQTLTARRLAGMAAELAGALCEGVACQVCGSATHPAPARAADDAVREADQAQADDGLTAATHELDGAAAAVQAARHRRDLLLAAADGRDLETATAEHLSATDALVDAEAAATEAADLTRALTALRQEQADLLAQQAAAATQTAIHRQAADAHQARADLIDAEIATARRVIVGAIPGGVPGGVTGADSSLRDHVDALRSHLATLDRMLTARRSLEAAQERCADLSARVLRTAQEHGFEEVASVLDALLPDADRARLQEQLAQRVRTEAQAQAVLADLADAPDSPTLDRADADPGDDADPDRLAAQLVLADTQVALTSRARHLAEERHLGLLALTARLDEELAAWAPARDRHLTADSMSRLVRGMGHDNQLQMRLSAYVLATRLDQVVEAANERLGHMRDQRYLLQRTGRAARRRSQAGLGLEVVDQWTGDVRDPSTLSGGETFLVSLSLALGLADVVTQEAGGIQIDTLFVDEGFGTLDADTLDDVMDRLDGLRAGGRTVGVVSHVSELRNRIPTQVHVDKTRTGSTVDVRTLVG